MITIEAFMHELSAKGIQLSIEKDSDIKIRGDGEALSDELVEAIKRRKPELLRLLQGKPSKKPEIWTSEVGCLGDHVAADTETSIIPDDDRVSIPQLVLGSASKGTNNYIIEKTDIPIFLEMHINSTLIFHNASFDRNVIWKATGIDLCDWLDRGLLIDTGMLHLLHALADTGDVPERWKLELCCREHLGIELGKAPAIQCTFGKYLKEDGSVDFDSIDIPHLEYAVKDAAATFQLYRALRTKIEDVCAIHGVDPNLLLGHDVLLKSAIALDNISRNGMCIDQEKVSEMKADLKAKNERLLEELFSSYGLKPGNGSGNKFQEIMSGIEIENNIFFPRTGGGKITSKADLLGEYTSHPFISRYIDFKSNEHLLSNFISKLDGGRKVHPFFIPLLKTGRTSCRNPNTQHIPRDDHVRELFITSPGTLLLDADYQGIEMCGLAQHVYEKYGFSKMRDIINEGKDLHYEFGARITGKAPDKVTKDERQKAKAVNFALPGGMGPPGLMEYARVNFGLHLTEDEAIALKQAWFNMFPEMADYMSERTDIVEYYGLTENPFGWDEDIMAAVFRKILSGDPYARSGNPYQQEIIEWVWDRICHCNFRMKKKFNAEIESMTGSKELYRCVEAVGSVIWKTGMIRRSCNYCQGKNGPFQGLVAAGAKLAMYRLFREGYRIINYVHDEFLIEISLEADHLAIARQVEKIMIEEMAKMIPDVKIGVNYALMDRWHKKAEAVFDDPKTPTRLLLWKPESIRYNIKTENFYRNQTEDIKTQKT